MERAARERAEAELDDEANAAAVALYAVCVDFATVRKPPETAWVPSETA